MSTTIKNPLIKVSGNELQFIRKHAPTAFSRTIAEALAAEGHTVDRVTVHKELHSIKDNYNPIIIGKARQLLKDLYKVEFPHFDESFC